MDHAQEPGLRRRDFLGRLSPLMLAAVAGPSVAAAQQAAQPAAAPDAGIGTVWWVELVSSSGGRFFDFYKKTLKWSSRPAGPASDGPAEGTGTYTLFEAAGSDVAGATVASKADPAKQRPMWIVYFRVDNVEKSIARALEGGGRLLQAPYDVPDTARMAVLQDLDGVLFGVAAPLTS